MGAFFLRNGVFIIVTLGLGATIALGFFWLWTLFFLILFAPLFLVGVYDLFQTQRNVLRVYPIWAHWRYILTSIRPMIQQYFIASNTSERPFSREQRELVYERATKTLDTLPFGTQHDVDAVGYEWMAHSLAPKVVDKAFSRITIGGPDCKKPYSASRLNISAMSYGALSRTAVRALNLGAKLGNFYHNTGEGGLSRYHLMEGGDIVFQIGTAYFGCRSTEGGFDAEKFKEKANLDVVKMIEIKLSQGAKPSHGGLLPAAKITKEISEIRNVPMGQDCLSPAAHSTFSTPEGLLKWLQELREMCGGKPVGFKLCIGSPSEFMGICKAMLSTGILPDFITVDGAEGGTGAAPVEFTNRLGTPLNEGIIFVNNCLEGIGVRDKVRVIASGKIITGFDMASKIALGADVCNSARGMLLSLGCLQSRRCNKNDCPTGITSQDPVHYRAISINAKGPHVKNFHDATLESFLEVIGACGVENPSQLKPYHIYRRVADAKALHYDQAYEQLRENQLVDGSDDLPKFYKDCWNHARTDAFVY